MSSEEEPKSQSCQRCKESGDKGIGIRSWAWCWRISCSYFLNARQGHHHNHQQSHKNIHLHCLHFQLLHLNSDFRRKKILKERSSGSALAIQFEGWQGYIYYIHTQREERGERREKEKDSISKVFLQILIFNFQRRLNCPKPQCERCGG